MNHQQLRDYIIRPVLNQMGVYSRAAENLLILTACAESQCGQFIHQVGGPAMGIYQMEPATHDDIHDNWLPSRPTIARAIGYLTPSNRADQMIGNLFYATAMARAHYLRVPSALPDAEDLEGLATYWKRHYNTELGRGRIDHAVKAYWRWGS